MDKEKKECPKGQILREGYEKEEHLRTEYSKCPPKHTSCKKSEKIMIPATIVKKTTVPATCITDVGKEGKTPESEKWASKMEKGGLGQYFDNEQMAYDDKSCIKAGIRARKWGHDSKRQLHGKFIQQINLRSSPEKEAEARKFERCRQNALIAYDPSIETTVYTKFPDIQVDATEVRKKLKDLETDIYREK